VKLSLVLLKQPRLRGVLPRCGRLHLDFGNRHLDEIAEGDETDQSVSLHHGHVAARRVVISDIGWLIRVGLSCRHIEKRLRKIAKAPAPKDASSKVRSWRDQVPRCEAGGISDLIGMRQNAVYALPGIGQGIFLSWHQTSQSGLRQNGQI
jgi:hypothetical protein